MNFELKSLTLPQAAATPCDALVVLFLVYSIMRLFPQKGEDEIV